MRRFVSFKEDARLLPSTLGNPENLDVIPKTGLMRSRRHALSSAHAVAILAPEEVFG